MIHLRIEELVLHGVDPRDRHAIADAVRVELARLFAGGLAMPASPLRDVRDVRGIAGAVASETHRAVETQRSGDAR